MIAAKCKCGFGYASQCSKDCPYSDEYLSQALMKNNNKEKVNSYIIEVLKKYRKEAKYTQADIAQMLDITRTSYINIEAGRHFLSADKIYILSCIFKKPIESFFPEQVLIIPQITETVKTVVIKKKKKIRNVKKINL